jgi:nicotinamide phosphoribosyltransferase
VDRPDSGERGLVLPELLRIHADAFGTTKNSKGYDVVNYGLKALWADGMNERTVIQPFQLAQNMGISADSVMTGAGGGIAAADLDRDTDRWAMKASEYVLEDGSRLDVFKDPITDKGKQSKKGRFGVVLDPFTGPATVRRENGAEVPYDMLWTRFLNGNVLNASKLDSIRALVDRQL